MKTDRKDGLDLCARFSYITNKLEYCGPKDCTKKLHDMIVNGSNRKEVLESLKRFEGLLPYLSVISDKPFTFDAVEAYWIGNELLDRCGKEENIKIIENLVKNGLPKFLGKKLIEKLPDGCVPHHSFNVFFVGVGQLTGSVATTPENMDKCRISAGRIESIYRDKLKVLTNQVYLEEGKIRLRKVIKEVSYEKGFLYEIKVGNHVGIHWDKAVVVLSAEQVNNLKKYTQINIDAINGM
jgi:hypothetical protein